GRDLALEGLGGEGLEPEAPMGQDQQRLQPEQGQSQLLADLAQRALLGRFARLEPSARQRPQPFGGWPVALDEQHLVAVQQGGAGSEKAHGATRRDLRRRAQAASLPRCADATLSCCPIRPGPAFSGCSTISPRRRATMWRRPSPCRWWSSARGAAPPSCSAGGSCRAG